LTVTGGDNQKIAVNTTFANPLAVAVGSHQWDGQGEPVDGGGILFQSPAAPDAGITVAPTATVEISGAQAVLFATANSVAGRYVVTAGMTGGDATVLFNLENLPSPFAAPAQLLLPEIGK
jgi:hypothetical protein